MNEDLINVSIIYFLGYNYFIHRAMRIFLIFTLILILVGCNSIEVAKEVAKASKSISASVNQVINIEKKTKKIDDKEIVDNDETSAVIDDSIEKEKKILEVAKKKEKKLVTKQKKIIKINFIGKTLNKIKSSLGEPQLIRLDGNTKTVRFDKNSCRLFLFFNSHKTTPLVEHFEIRNIKGDLINSKEKIQVCYKYFNLT